jgi:hypothetical protein
MPSTTRSEIPGGTSTDLFASPSGEPNIHTESPTVREDRQYEFTSVQTLRGMEGKTIAKWQGLGWEVVK